MNFQSASTFKLFEAKSFGKVITGAPYSATAVTEHVQTLGDGNQIIRKNEAKVYRDSEGRTRREQKLDSIGKWTADGEAPQMIYIQDPVAGFRYNLDPRTRTAHKQPAPPFKWATRQGEWTNEQVQKVVEKQIERRKQEMDKREEDNRKREEILEQRYRERKEQTEKQYRQREESLKKQEMQYIEKTKENSARHEEESKERLKQYREQAEQNEKQYKDRMREMDKQYKEEEKARERQFKERRDEMKRREQENKEHQERVKFIEKQEKEKAKQIKINGKPAIEDVMMKKEIRSPEGNKNIEGLGKQTIEGIEAEGKRSTRTIAVGEIGNVRPIEIIDEIWYSAALQVQVMTRHSDPRSGVTTYRLTSISRKEPQRSLFEVPADYKLVGDEARPKKRVAEPRAPGSKPAPDSPSGPPMKAEPPKKPRPERTDEEQR
jgi:hypothetical protein